MDKWMIMGVDRIDGQRMKRKWRGKKCLYGMERSMDTEKKQNDSILQASYFDVSKWID